MFYKNHRNKRRAFSTIKCSSALGQLPPFSMSSFSTLQWRKTHVKVFTEKGQFASWALTIVLKTAKQVNVLFNRSLCSGKHLLRPKDFL